MMLSVEQTQERVAVIDDEAAIRDMLEVGLTLEGFAVRTAVDGADGLALVRDWQPSCIVLDVVMPKIDGIALIPLLRRLTEVPIVMLTARGDVRDRIDGLRAGADDYLAKPFDLEELAARIQTALRRPMLRHVEHLTFSDLTIDLETRIVRRGERRLELSMREFDLLVTLARRPNRVFTREELLDHVWGVDRDLSPNTVETYISYVRAKVDADGAPRLIHTIRGVGYSLRES
ncbi:MAG TPA: response regulator transcription factor [Candidatus Elarobacter sp.]|jgi:two-component system response regulator MprA|nr:response regulator transcription factor [Candidatus Elarobacter sp.]